MECKFSKEKLEGEILCLKHIIHVEKKLTSTRQLLPETKFRKELVTITDCYSVPIVNALRTIKKLPLSDTNSKFAFFKLKEKIFHHTKPFKKLSKEIIQQKKCVPLPKKGSKINFTKANQSLSKETLQNIRHCFTSRQRDTYTTSSTHESDIKDKVSYIAQKLYCTYTLVLNKFCPIG